MNTVYVAHSSQLVPVLVALTEAALETEVVRAEIEEGVKQGKDKVREGREGLKLEQERWEKLKEKEKDPKSKEAGSAVIIRISFEAKLESRPNKNAKLINVSSRTARNLSK